jgi:hypothetical protein
MSMSEKIEPCPSVGLAVLGSAEENPVHLRCNLLVGHRGWHQFEMAWNENCTCDECWEVENNGMDRPIEPILSILEKYR